MRVRRYDGGKLAAPEITDEGYLRCWGTFARTGIQEYKRADGGAFHEFRPADEVGRVDSLASFAGKAITLEHPPEMLNSENTAKYQVGFTDSEVVFDGTYARVRLTITDKDAIASVMDGKTPELSAGYEVFLDETPGVDSEGCHYDAVQREIMGNHIALTAIGRAGPRVKPHLDSSDAIATEAIVQPIAKPRMAQITISGAQYDVSEAVAAAYTSAQRSDALVHQEKLDTATNAATAAAAERDQLKTQAETLQGTIDELRPRVDSLNAELEEAKKSTKTDSSEDIDAAVEARLELIRTAEAHLDSEYEFKGKAPRQIKEDVLKAIHGDSLDLTGKSEVYVDARFDAVLDLVEQGDSSQALRESVAAAVRGDSADEGESGKARANYQARLTQAHMSNSRKEAA